MPNATRFKHMNVPKQPGEQGRLKVVQGPDYGTIYVLNGKAVTIGRGEENDVVISDLKASRRHAALQLGNNGGWTISDIGSANGILVNGKPAPQSLFRTRDTVTLGETTLEFVGAEAGTELLLAPPPSAMQVQNLNAAREAQVRKFDNNFSSKKPKILVIGGAALAVLFMLPSDPPKQQQQSRKKDDGLLRDLASYLPTAPEGAENKNAEMFFKAGFREYRERNYIRAQSQFETALQLAPAHPLARLYLENSRRGITEEVKFHLEKGKKSLDAGKLKSARGHFEQVMRLLYRDPANPSYAEAKDQLMIVQKAEGENSG